MATIIRICLANADCGGVLAIVWFVWKLFAYDNSYFGIGYSNQKSNQMAICINK